MDHQYPAIQGGQERRLVAFNVNIYTRQDPINNFLTAHGLRDFLNKHFMFMDGLNNGDSNLVVEVKYKVIKS